MYNSEITSPWMLLACDSSRETLAPAKLHYSKQDETNLGKSQMSHIQIALQIVGENIT